MDQTEVIRHYFSVVIDLRHPTGNPQSLCVCVEKLTPRTLQRFSEALLYFREQWESTNGWDV